MKAFSSWSGIKQRGNYLRIHLACSFPGGSAAENLPAKQETQFQSLGGEDPLEKEMATHPSILAWEIPWSEGPDRSQSIGSQKKSDTT